MMNKVMRSRADRKPHPVLVRLPAELWDRVEAMADREFTPPAVIVRRLTAERLAQMPEGAPAHG
jgi:hypothetical protein